MSTSIARDNGSNGPSKSGRIGRPRLHRLRSCQLALVIGLSLNGVVFGNTSAATYDLRCGAYCLYVGLGAVDAELPEFEKFLLMLGEPGPSGYSMQQLADCAQKFGCETLGVQTTIESLRERTGRFACVTLLAGHHFVLVTEILDKEVAIIDPPRQSRISVEAFQNQWNGESLLVSRSSLLPEESLVAQLRRRALVKNLAICIACAAVVGLTAISILRRRRIVAAVVTIVSILCMVSGCSRDITTAVVTPEGGPEIYVPDSDQNAGLAAPEFADERTFRYEISNRGTTVLTIDELIQSCSCTRCVLSRSVIPPGESAQLRVTINSGGRGEEVRVAVTIVSNDPRNGRLPVQAVWQPALPVTFEPERLNFGDVIRGQEVSANVIVRTSLDSNESTNSISASPPELLRAIWQHDVTPDQLQISLTPNSATTQFGEVVMTRGDRAYHLPVLWTVRERIEVRPAAIMVPNGQSGNRRRAEFRIASRPPEVLTVDNVSPGVGIDASSIQLNRISDSEYAGEVDIVLPESVGVFRTCLLVQCSSPEVREVQVPITAIVAESESP